MDRAINLSIDNVKKDMGGPFGCVIICNDKMIASAANSVVRDMDPTAHAEINTLRQACRILNRIDLSDCTVYSSCEPCPMCYSALRWAKISKIYFSSTREEASEAGFSDAEIYNEIIEKRQKYERVQDYRSSIAFNLWNSSEQKIHY